MPGTAHVRPDEHARVDDAAQILVRVVHIGIAHHAYAGPAREQQALQAGEGHQRFVGGSTVKVGVLVVARIHQRVLMGIDHAGQQGRIAQLDNIGPHRNDRAIAHRADVIALDQHHGSGAECVAAPVYHALRNQGRRGTNGGAEQRQRQQCRHDRPVTWRRWPKLWLRRHGRSPLASLEVSASSRSTSACVLYIENPTRMSAPPGTASARTGLGA